jgi:ribosomal protein L37AE/L43A
MIVIVDEKDLVEKLKEYKSSDIKAHTCKSCGALLDRKMGHSGLVWSCYKCEEEDSREQ